MPKRLKEMQRHVQESEEKSGKSPKEAERIGYATVNSRRKSGERPLGSKDKDRPHHKKGCSK